VEGARVPPEDPAAAAPSAEPSGPSPEVPLDVGIPPDVPEAETAGPNLPESVPEEVEEGAPAWVLTFGDLMSLLLTFFILLFSMSSVESEKFKAAAQSLQEAFGVADGEGFDTDATPLLSDSIPIAGPASDMIVDDILEEIRRELQQFVTDNQLEDKVLVAKEAEGVFLRMQSQALFVSGSAGVEPAGAEILELLGDITRLIEVPVSVTGHTDDTPMNSGSAGYRSNWELSAARAAGVARALVERGQDGALVTVESYGENRPIASNDTPAGRAENRRVELYYSRQGVTNTLVERGLIPDPDAPPPPPPPPVETQPDSTAASATESDG